MILTFDNNDWELDAALSFDYEDSADLTEHPIQKDGDKTKIADNIDNSPTTYKIKGIMSESPLRGGGFAGVRASFTENLAVQWAFVEAVREARRAKKLFTLDAGDMGVYDDLVMIRFNPSFSPQTGKSVHFTMSLKEVYFVETETTLSVSDSLGVSLDILQLLSDPLNSKTSTSLASGGQTELLNNALNKTGVAEGVDFARGR